MLDMCVPRAAKEEKGVSLEEERDGMDGACSESACWNLRPRRSVKQKIWAAAWPGEIWQWGRHGVRGGDNLQPVKVLPPPG